MVCQAKNVAKHEFAAYQLYETRSSININSCIKLYPCHMYQLPICHWYPARMKSFIFSHGGNYLFTLKYKEKALMSDLFFLFLLPSFFLANFVIDPQPWWQVDLVDSHCIGKITVTFQGIVNIFCE